MSLRFYHLADILKAIHHELKPSSVLSRRVAVGQSHVYFNAQFLIQQMKVGTGAIS